MIALGPIELELTPAKGGDAGWSEHWQVFVRRGKRRTLLGYAVSPEGAARIAVQAGLAEVQRGVAGQGLIDLREAVRRVTELLCTSAVLDRARGVQPGQDRRSAPE